MISGYDGEWSVYVKDLESRGRDFALNDKPLYSASLIKAFVMAKTYAGYGSMFLKTKLQQMKTTCR